MAAGRGTLGFGWVVNDGNTQNEGGKEIDSFGPAKASFGLFIGMSPRKITSFSRDRFYRFRDCSAGFSLE